MKTNFPKISIITINFNGEKTIRETIESVLNQNYPNIEYVLIDGDSYDGSYEIIKEYEEKIDIIINGTIPLKDNYFKLLTFFVSFDFKWAALFL